MSYTTNLGLKIIDGTDAFRENFTQGNYNANKIEEKIGGYLDDLETLPGIRTAITELNSQINTIEGEISEANQEINELAGDISVIIATKYKDKFVDSEGVTKEGTRYRYKVVVSPISSSSTTYLKQYDEEETTHRIAICSAYSEIRINLTEICGLNSISNFTLLNFVTYEEGYRSGVDQNNKGMAVRCIGQLPNDTNYYLIADVKEDTIYTQTYDGNAWRPGARPSFDPTREVIAVFEYFIADGE